MGGGISSVTEAFVALLLDMISIDCNCITISSSILGVSYY